MDNTLPKAEMLSGKVGITELVEKGRWGSVSELKYCWRSGNGAGRNRLMVSVPKKFFKRAVKRNLLKRRLRESYRTQKSLLPKDSGIDILLLYNTKEVLQFRTISEKVGEILTKIASSI